MSLIIISAYECQYNTKLAISVEYIKHIYPFKYIIINTTQGEWMKKNWSNTPLPFVPLSYIKNKKKYTHTHTQVACCKWNNKYVTYRDFIFTRFSSYLCSVTISHKHQQRYNKIIRNNLLAWYHFWIEIWKEWNKENLDKEQLEILCHIIVRQ